MIRFYILSFLAVFLLCACNKKGCTDYRALNHSKKAKVDDNSCVYAKRLIIRSVGLKMLSNKNPNGDSWDVNGLPDCQIKVSFGSQISFSEVYSEMPIGEYHEFNLETPINIHSDSILNIFSALEIRALDIDSSGDELISYADFSLEKEENGNLRTIGMQKYILESKHFFSTDINEYCKLVLYLQWETE